jgi:hypothetical protein
LPVVRFLNPCSISNNILTFCRIPSGMTDKIAGCYLGNSAYF